MSNSIWPKAEAQTGAQGTTACHSPCLCLPHSPCTRPLVNNMRLPFHSPSPDNLSPVEPLPLALLGRLRRVPAKPLQ